MSQSPRAVFLSYASQDGEAAQRLCDALRAEGVEVWFDRNELVGGDAWDTKIRRQIGACDLFLPLISANTEARLEGYFRLEWKIAAQRTQTMAEEKAFLLPIVIDGTRDAAAKVPAEFKAVQWTKLPGGEATPAFCARVKKLLEGGATWAEEPHAGSFAAARSERAKVRGLTRYLWAAFGIGLGLFFATRSLWWERTARAEKAAPASAVAAPVTTPAIGPASAPAAKFDPQRVVLTRFENLSGDPSLDALARVIEAELLRNFAPVQFARVQPVEVAGRVAGEKAAREVGAASFIAGSFLRAGDKLEITAQIVLTERGELFGSAGPVTVPVAAARSDGLAELAERLATGVQNTAATLQSPPTRIAAAIYTRPWPRYPVVGRIATLRNLPSDQADVTIEGYRKLLQEAPELLKIKHDLARLLRDRARFDESQKVFNELLREDISKLSEIERYAVEYDDALLAGDPNRALGAARNLLELRPVGDAISQVVACLWGLNRPAAAYRELAAWWEKYGASLPPQSRASTHGGLFATKALMQVMQREPENALQSLAEMEKVIDGQTFNALAWLRFQAFEMLGREADQQKLIAEMAATPGGGRINPFFFQWVGYQLALHLGRTESAAKWLAALERDRAEFERTGQFPEGYNAILMLLHDAAGRPEAALQVLTQEKADETVHTVGMRAALLRSLGRTAEAEAEERKLDRWERRNSRGLPSYWRARIAVRAGEKERAVALLREAVASGLWFGGFTSPSFEFGRSEPEFAKLRGYAPYDELVRPKG